MSGPERLRSLVVLVVVVAPAGVASSAAEPDSRAAFTMAVELVRGGDPDMRTVALERLRDGLPGAAFTVELAETLLPSLPADGQVRLLSTLAGRGDAAALAGVVKAASSTYRAARRGPTARTAASSRSRPSSRLARNVPWGRRPR